MDLPDVAELQTPPVPPDRKHLASPMAARATPGPQGSVLRLGSLNRAAALRTPLSSRKLGTAQGATPAARKAGTGKRAGGEPVVVA